MPARSLQSIVLSAKRSSWRMLDTHADEADKRYMSIRSTVLERDDHTCGFCGLRALKFQEVHHLDDDHGNNAPKNLLTTCCLCHLCFHLGMAGIRNAGTIIWCPEVGQADLNNLCRAIFVAVANHGSHENSARKLYESLSSRDAIIKEELGDGASNPGSLGQAFLEMTPDQYDSRNDRMPGLRLLPRMTAFGKQIAYWQSEPSAYGNLADGEWAKLLPASAAEIEQPEKQKRLGTSEEVGPVSDGGFFEESPESN